MRHVQLMGLVKKGRWLVVLLMVISMAASAQQDAQFSQYTFNGIYINPAYAGYKRDLYMNAFYRSQWTGFDGAPRTFSLAADGAVNDNKVGLGLLVFQDKIGAQSNLSAYANYAYRVQLGDNENSRLAFGIGAGLVQNGLDGTKLNAVNPDVAVPAGYQSSILPDARAGILYTNDSFFAGASVDNLVAHVINKNKTSTMLAPVPVPHYYLTAGALLNVNDQTKFKPSFLIKDDHGGPTSLDINAFMLFNDRIWIGATYRTAITLYNKPNLQDNLQKANAVVGVVEIFATERLRIGYAFDYSLTKLSSYSYGSHELSIGIYLKHNKEEDNFNKCYF